MVLPRETHPVECARTEVFHHHIGFLNKLLQDFLAFGLLGVEREGLLVAVEHREIQRVDVRDIAQLRAGDIARARAFNLDHVGAEPRKQLRAGRTCLHVREVDNLDSLEWLAHDSCLLTHWLKVGYSCSCGGIGGAF
jgi:hypothetical protein